MYFSFFKFIFQPHSRPVNSLDFDRFSPSKLVSCSYDGSLRRLDLERGVVELLYGDEEDSVFASYHAQVDANSFLVGLGSAGDVGVLDTRESNLKFARTVRVFDYRTAVKTVDVHPLRKDIFLTCSSKGHCATFDLRSSAAAKKKSNPDPVLSFSGHTKALSSAFFSPVTGKSIATVPSFDQEQKNLFPVLHISLLNQQQVVTLIQK